MYKEKGKLETGFSDTQLAHMISINDYARIKLLKDGKVDEANRKAKENYESVKKKRIYDFLLVFGSIIDVKWQSLYTYYVILLGGGGHIGPAHTPY